MGVHQREYVKRSETRDRGIRTVVGSRLVATTAQIPRSNWAQIGYGLERVQISTEPPFWREIDPHPVMIPPIGRHVSLIHAIPAPLSAFPVTLRLCHRSNTSFANRVKESGSLPRMNAACTAGARNPGDVVQIHRGKHSLF